MVSCLPGASPWHLTLGAAAAVYFVHPQPSAFCLLCICRTVFQRPVVLEVPGVVLGPHFSLAALSSLPHSCLLLPVQLPSLLALLLSALFPHAPLQRPFF